MEETDTAHISGSEPQADTTQADTSNSESVPSETTKTVAENNPQESATAEKNEQEVAETTPQNGEVAKEAQPTVEASTQTNEVAQNGSEKEEKTKVEIKVEKDEIQEVEKVISEKPDTKVKANAPKKEVPIVNTKDPQSQESAAAEKNEQEVAETVPQNGKVAEEAQPNVEANTQTNEATQSEGKTEETQTTETKSEPAEKAEPTSEKVSNDTKIEETQAQTQPTTVVAAETTLPNSKPAEETQPSEETNAEPVTPVVSENKVSQPTEREKTQEASKVTSQASPKQEQPETKPQAEPARENGSTVNTKEPQSQESATAVTEQPAKVTSTKAEQSVTASTTVNTGNSVVENPENTTQPAVNSESSESKSRRRRSISQPQETSTDETTATSTEKTTVADSSRRRSRRSVHSVPHNVKSATTSSNGRSAVALLRDLTSTNTNAVLSDAMAKAQFVALNVGKAVSQHISQLEMNNEGQYNVWVSNTSMNENYSSSQYRRFSSKSTQTQLGWDQTISNNVQLGGVFTYVRNSNSFDKASSKNTLAQANLYSKYYVDNHWYLAVDLGYGNFQSNLQTNHNAKFARHTAQIGLTAGKAFNLGNFGITPIVGVRYSYLSNADFALAQDRIKVNPISVKTAFAQVDLSYTYHLGEFSITPILSARYDANQGSGKINVNGYDFAYNVENQQQYNAGLKLKYHNVKLSLIGGLTKAKQAEKQKTAEVKLSFSF
ncbi:Immunoglobulin A1 protease autotransporter precursor [Haemophilus influenzae]|nr:Immunoglobulin A1 protease autotransporter precursor [Haemophilus influenzae]